MLHFSKLFLIFSLAAWVQAAKPLEPMKAAPVLEKTLYFLDALELKEDIIPYFDSGFKTDLLVQQSRQTWDYLEKTYGGFNEAQGLLAYAKEHGTLVFGKLLFQKRAMGLKLSFSHALRIKHWEFIPVRNLPATVRRNRPYGKSADFSIENLKLGKKEESLGARLYLPKGVKSPPVLVLLHDFGPQDLYHRVGRNPFFKDLAEGLASTGVATTLYPKRSHSFPAELKTRRATPSWEVLQDLFALIYRLRTQVKTRFSKLFLGSFGSGAYLIPYLTQQKFFNGFILLNPSLRHPLDLLFEKEEIASHLQSGPRKNLLELANQIDDFHKGVLDPSTILFGYRASYFQGLSRYAPQVIKKDSENKPVLMLLSEHNSSRNSSDLETIHKILANLEVRKEYLWGLNRVFHTSNHDPPLDEFYPPGFVSPKVIKILKDWILKKNS